jgi:isochorismate hydrolase
MHLRSLTPSNCVLLICDIQERFIPLIYRSSTVVNTCRYMTNVASVLNIPMVCTQQYTKAFGKTADECFASPDIRTMAMTPHVYEKKKFSMLTDEVQERLDTMKSRDRYILLGIEAHVCLQQTCLDLLRQNSPSRPVNVYVIVDGVSSQQPYDRSVALQRMTAAGAILTTAQSLTFELMQTAEHEHFKTISKITVEHMKLPNEFNADFQ